MSNQYAEILRNTAEEIRAQDILGWGNACEFGAQEIERLEAEIAKLKSVHWKPIEEHNGET